MAGSVHLRLNRSAPRARHLTEPAWLRWTLTGLVLAFLALFLLLPLAVVFTEAFSKGWSAYAEAITSPDAISALQLTLFAAAIAVPLNLLFGIAAGWAIAKFDFPGKNLLIDADRPAIRRVAGDRRHGLRAALRTAGRARALGRRARHQDHLRRSGHRAGNDVRLRCLSLRARSFR